MAILELFHTEDGCLWNNFWLSLELILVAGGRCGLGRVEERMTGRLHLRRKVQVSMSSRAHVRVGNCSEVVDGIARIPVLGVQSSGAYTHAHEAHYCDTITVVLVGAIVTTTAPCQTNNSKYAKICDIGNPAKWANPPREL